MEKQKVSIIGAGNVGATAAQFLAVNEICDEVVLLDIKPGVAEGKAIDIMQTSNVFGFATTVKGVTGDYGATEDSDVIVITSGVPRKPGMTREELVGVNSGVVKSVLDSVVPLSPNATIIMVSNPMDTMTYFAVKYLEGKVPAEKIIGMGGILDSARFTYYISEKADIPQFAVNAFVIGGHGDKTMIPVVSMATVSVQEQDSEEITDLSAEEFISQDDMAEIVHNTMVGGATLTGLLGTSAWQAPAAAIAELVTAVLLPESSENVYTAPCSVYNAEYDACIGVMCEVKSGKATALPIENYTTEEERTKFKESLEAVKTVNASLTF